MNQIHCHVCGGFVTDPAAVSYRRPVRSVVAAQPHSGLCPCAPAVVYGPPDGYMSSPGLPAKP